jgi:uncharacterized protein (TIRG00374 family)
VTSASTAPVSEPNPSVDEDADDEAAPRIEFTGRKLAAFIAFVVLSLVALYFLLPQLTGLDDTWHRIEQGNPAWLLVALGCTVGMFGGYVFLFQGIFGNACARRLGIRESYEITMAALAATRLFSAGGAGGLILIAWALRRAGMRKQEVADKTISFLVLTYLVYTTCLVLFGFGLHFQLLPGPDPFAITFVPALLALIITAVGLSIAFVPTDFATRLEGFAARGGRLASLAQRLALVPATISAGMRDALRHLGSRDPALLGALLFWAFQVGALWACFHAFGDSPHLAVLIVGFFVGMLGNLLPLPGGIGGVDGGMIGAFAAFGVDAGLAVVAVLTYRGFTFWLPTLPGVVAYLQLRRTVERWRVERRYQATAPG